MGRLVERGEGFPGAGITRGRFLAALARWPASRAATLEEMEARVEDALSQSRSGALGIAENLDEIHRGGGWQSLGYASFADYVTGEFATREPFPIPYGVISNEVGEPLPVFEMAESIQAWGVARAVEPLLRDDEP